MNRLKAVAVKVVWVLISAVIITTLGLISFFVSISEKPVKASEGPTYEKQNEITELAEIRSMFSMSQSKYEEAVETIKKNSEVLKENTAALSAIKDTIAANESKQKPNESEEVFKAIEAELSKFEVSPQTEALKMAWNIEGNWTPTEEETKAHLREDHKVSTDGMSHQQMLTLHDQLHEGAKNVAVKYSTNYKVQRQPGLFRFIFPGNSRSRRTYNYSGKTYSTCPSGTCPK